MHSLITLRLPVADWSTNGTGQFAGGDSGFDVISRISQVGEGICDNF